MRHLLTSTASDITVCLEKTSDPSNVLEESSHPLQATGTLALLPPGDDYTPVLATISLILSRELVEHILLLLDTKSILQCGLANKEFNAIIQSSILVQYYLACEAAGVIDNPQSPLSCAERLEALNKREHAWRKLKPVFETTIKVDDHPSAFADLTAGNYFLLSKNAKDPYYYHLPSSPQDNPQWLRIPGHGPRKGWSGSIVGMGMAVYEHDLVVNVISSDVGNQADMQRHSLDLVLLKFSTGEYHPLARHSLIHVQRSSSTEPYTTVRIVGNNLALVVHDQDGSKLFIFDWKTGHKRLQHKATEGAYEYSVPVFVSPELLLVPNRILFRFEVWHLFPSHPNPKPPIQILSLQLPAVPEYYYLIGIYCYGEPGLHSMPYIPPRPFFPSSENSIITVNLRFEYYTIASACTLIAHRRALLDTIQKWTSPSLLDEQKYLPRWLTSEVIVHKVTNPVDGSVRLGAQSELVSTMPHQRSTLRTRDSPTLATSQISVTSSTSHISVDSSSSGSGSSTSRYDILQVRWVDWGPPISRWFRETQPHPWCINQCTGQRYVFLDRNPRDNRKCMVGVADFNLHNVRRHAEMMAQLRGREGEDSGGHVEGKKEENEEELEKLYHEGEFGDQVYMGLKCVVYHLPGEYDFDAVWMDEERLLGFKHNWEESIRVLYFG